MKIGIAGATGEVGRMMLKTLFEENIPFSEIVLLASEKSEGKIIQEKEHNFRVQALTETKMKDKYDYLLFSAGEDVSRKFSPIAAKNGNIVIDNSSAFRTDEHIPLIVPEINGYILKNYKGIIANPNCSTIQLVLAINLLHKEFIINKLIVSTYQSVSGAGNKGIKELTNQKNGSDEVSVFQKKINNNVIPQIGKFSGNKYSSEEIKMMFETNKILSSDIAISATTVRVPVIYGHSESVYVEFEKTVDLEKAEELLLKSPSVIYYSNNEYVTPIETESSTMSHVCRLRYGTDKKSLTFWNVGNNVRLGAATNAVRILQKIEELKE